MKASAAYAIAVTSPVRHDRRRNWWFRFRLKRVFKKIRKRAEAGKACYVLDSLFMTAAMKDAIVDELRTLGYDVINTPNGYDSSYYVIRWGHWD